MSRIKWIIFIVLTLGVFGALIISSNGSKLNTESIDINAIQSASDQNGNIADHVYGKIDSTVTLIDYGDFQCPACASIHPKIKEVVEQYKNQIRYVFRNFPLTSIHPNAKASAGTAEAAGLQGKYWEMYNKLYENQSDWSALGGSERTSFFESYAKDLDLDIDKFKSDLSSAPTTINKKIDYDTALGRKAGIEGTPTFYLNGIKLDSKVWSDISKLKEAINTELIKAGIELPKTN